MATTTLIFGLMALLALGTSVYVLLRNRRLENEVVRDALTEVGNRRGFDEFLSEHTPTDKLALVMIDFDHFKSLNDSQGHQAGDEALRRVATALHSSVTAVYHERAHVYRLGGDEFAIVIEGADKLHAAALVERTRQQVSEALLAHERMLTLSCGIACTPEHATNVPELVSYADRALYQAKRAGRDRSVVYSPSMFDVDPGRDSRRVLQTLADALAAAVDAKDAYTHAHSRNVADLSLYLARTMGLSDEEVADIALGGLLHDIGKIGVSDHVLRKPGRLNDEEWEEIKTHCDIGYTILSGIEGAQHIREMVLYHHERPDGRGYPRGLSGDEIPMAARIIGVADAFDSMTAERVYSRPRSPDDALAEIVRLAGDQFDAKVVDALCQLMLFELAPAASEYDPQPTAALEAFPDTSAYTGATDSDEDDEGQDHAAAA